MFLTDCPAAASVGLLAVGELSPMRNSSHRASDRVWLSQRCNQDGNAGVWVYDYVRLHVSMSVGVCLHVLPQVSVCLFMDAFHFVFLKEHSSGFGCFEPSPDNYVFHSTAIRFDSILWQWKCRKLKSQNLLHLISYVNAVELIWHFWCEGLKGKSGYIQYFLSLISPNPK